MFGDRIRHLREYEGLTQKDLSEKLGLSPSTLAHYESGRREPDLEILKKCANYFDVSIDYLLSNEKCEKETPLIPLKDDIVNLLKRRNIIAQDLKLDPESLNFLESAIMFICKKFNE